MKFTASRLEYAVTMLAVTAAMATEKKKKFTLLVGNPGRTVTNLFTGWFFIYFHQLTSRKGNAIIEATNAQLEIAFKVFIDVKINNQASDIKFGIFSAY